MATVPRLSLASVAPNAAPNVQLQNTQSADLLTVGARQQQALGGAIEAAGGAMAALQAQAREQANALRVDDALNQAQERAIRLQHDPAEGYTALKGFDALNRESGQPLAEEFTGKLDADLSKIAGSLGNERQRQMFQMRANNLRTQFLGGALTYEGTQQKEYTLSVREATVKNAADTLVINSDDPKNIEMQVTRIRSAILGGVDPDSKVFVPGSAQMLGKSASWGEEKAAEAVSGAHTAAVQKFMEAGDMNGAMRYRKTYGQQMTASDMLKIDGTLQKNYETMRGAAVGNAVAQAALPSMQPTDMDRMRAVRDKLESGGRGDFNPDGTLLLGPVTKNGERAMGSAQVMPSTARDPGYGIRPANLTGSLQQQAAEIKRVGDQKQEVLIKMFNGDVAKAMAAYNWGEGNVKDAERKAQAAAGKGELVQRDAWLAYAPNETRKYVGDFLRLMADPVASAPTRPTADQLVQKAASDLGPNASPWAVKAATEAAMQKFELQSKAIAQRKDETIATAYQALEKNGGRWSELPATLRAKVEQLAPDKIDDLRNFGVRTSKGDDVTDDRLYLRLTTNPEAMAKMSDAQFYQLRNGLSKADFDHFTKQRADLRAGKGSNTPGDLNTSAVSRVANSRLQSLGIDPTPKDGSADAQRVGAIRRFIDSSLIDAQQQVGKKFDDAQVQAHIDGLFAKNIQFRTSFLGFSTGKSGQSMLSMKVGDIPSGTVDAIKKAFKAQGNDKPTDADVLGAYFAAHATSRPSTGGVTGSF